MEELSRRQFVIRSGAAVGALALGGVQTTLASESAANAVSDSHLKTYLAVVRAVGDVERNGIDPRSGEAEPWFMSYYATQMEPTREILVGALEALEKGAPNGAYSEAGRETARETLRTWLKGPTVRPSSASGEAATLEEYLATERAKDHPARTAASCDPEADGSCPPGLPSPSLPQRAIAGPDFGPAAKRRFAAREVLKLALGPFAPLPAGAELSGLRI